MGNVNQNIEGLLLGISIGANIVLVLEVARLRRAIWDATKRINYLGRVLSSHASGNGKHADQVERLP